MFQYRHIRSPMRERLVNQGQNSKHLRADPTCRRERSRYARPRWPRLPKLPSLPIRRYGLLAAFAAVIGVNVVVISMHGSALSSQQPTRQGPPLPTEKLSAPALVPSISLLDGLVKPAAPVAKPRAAVDHTVDGVTAAAPLKVASLTLPSPVVPTVQAVVHEPSAAALPAAPSERVITAELGVRKTLAGALNAEGLAREAVQEIVAALQGKFDFRRARAGDSMSVTLDASERVKHFEYRAQTGGPAGEIYVAERGEAGLEGRREEVKIEVRESLVSGQVHSTLYESMLATGEGTSLIGTFADVFGWEIDFHREVREGDRFRMLVEKHYVGDKFIGYGRLLAGEYSGRRESYRAFYYQDAHADGYFNERGESMQKTFLKAPVAVARVTSGFGKRKHPILGYTRAHNGIDYGVPRGTPIWTVANGKITARHYEKGYGNVVKVRHPNGYETIYAHMSKFADLKVGSKVRQRQVIGYCGSTGMSTGPHVHFGMRKGGRYLNPLKQKFPRGQAIAKAARAGFARHMQELAAQLETTQIALAQEPSNSQG